MLQEIEGPRAFQRGIVVEPSERGATGAKAVHEQQREGHALALAQPQDLLRDQVEEGVVAAHGQQALGTRESHRGPEPAVQLDHDRRSERLATRRLARLVTRELVRMRQRRDGRDRVLGEGGRTALPHESDRAQEAPNRDLGHAFREHALPNGLRLRCLPVAHPRSSLARPAMGTACGSVIGRSGAPREQSDLERLARVQQRPLPTCCTSIAIEASLIDPVRIPFRRD